MLFDSRASHSFVSSDFVSKHNLKAVTLDKGSYCISAAGNNISTNHVVLGATLDKGSYCICFLLFGCSTQCGYRCNSGNEVDEW